MTESNNMVEYAMDSIVHALQPDTIILDDGGSPVENREAYKQDLLRDLFALVGEYL